MSLVLLGTLVTLIECWGFPVLVHAALPLGEETLIVSSEEEQLLLQPLLAKLGLGKQPLVRCHRITGQTRVALSSDRVSLLNQPLAKSTVAACSLTPAGHYLTDCGPLITHQRSAGEQKAIDLVAELEASLQVPLDSAEWSSLLHGRGLRIRNLGVMYRASRLPHVREAILVEMVARVIKGLLGARLRGCLLQLRQVKAQVRVAEEASKEREELLRRLEDPSFLSSHAQPHLSQHFGVDIASNAALRQLPHKALLLALDHHCGRSGVRRMGGSLLPGAEHHLQVLAEGGECCQPDGGQRTRLAEALLKMGEIKAASLIYPTGHGRLAECHLKEGSFEAALKAVDEACGPHHAQPILIRDQVAGELESSSQNLEMAARMRQEALAAGRRLLGRSHSLCQALLIRHALLLLRLEGAEGIEARERVEEALSSLPVGMERMLLLWARGECQGGQQGREDLSQALRLWQEFSCHAPTDDHWSVVKSLMKHLRISKPTDMEEALVERLAALDLSLALPTDIALDGAIPMITTPEQGSPVELQSGLTREGRECVEEAAELVERLVEGLRRRAEGEDHEGERLARLIRTIVQLRLWLANPAQRIIIADRWTALHNRPFSLDEWSGPVRELLVRLITGTSNTTTQWIQTALSECLGVMDEDLKIALALVHMIR